MAEKESLDDAELFKRLILNWWETNKVLFGIGVIVFLGFLFAGYKYFDNRTHDGVDARITVVENQLENEITDLENQVINLENQVINLEDELRDVRICIFALIDSINALDGSNSLYHGPGWSPFSGDIFPSYCVEVG